MGGCGVCLVVLFLCGFVCLAPPLPGGAWMFPSEERGDEGRGGRSGVVCSERGGVVDGRLGGGEELWM